MCLAALPLSVHRKITQLLSNSFVKAIRLNQSHAAINAQVLAQAANISKLNRHIEQVNAQHLQDRARWETERFTSNRMTDALLAHARTEGGVKAEHLERECARALADNFSLQARLQDALSRSRAAEEQLMMLRPYLLYGHGDTTKTHYGVAPTRAAAPHYVPATKLPYRSSINVGSQQSFPLPSAGSIAAGPALTRISLHNRPPSAYSGTAADNTTKDSTLSKSKSGSARAESGTSMPHTVATNVETTKSPDSLDYLISAARKVLDGDSSDASTSLPESSKNWGPVDRDEDTPAKSALDVLVAAAFADRGGSEEETTNSVIAEPQPAPRRSQRNRAKRGSTISRSTPFVGTDDGEEVETPPDKSHPPSRGLPHAPNNLLCTETETRTSTRSPALPAFMNFTPDYKNVPSATAGSPTPTGSAIYRRTPLLPFYQPPIPALSTQNRNKVAPTHGAIQSEKPRRARIDRSASEDEECDEGRPAKRRRDQTPERHSPTASNSTSPNKSPVCVPSLSGPQIYNAHGPAG